MTLEQPRLVRSRSRWTICANRDGETTETDRQKCLILLIAPGDFLFFWSVLCGDEKQISERRLQSGLLLFAEISTKSSGSKVSAELREDNCAQVCSSSFSQKWDGRRFKNANLCTEKSFQCPIFTLRENKVLLWHINPSYSMHQSKVLWIKKTIESTRGTTQHNFGNEK